MSFLHVLRVLTSTARRRRHSTNIKIEWPGYWIGILIQRSPMTVAVQTLFQKRKVEQGASVSTASCPLATEQLWINRLTFIRPWFARNRHHLSSSLNLRKILRGLTLLSYIPWHIPWTSVHSSFIRSLFVVRARSAYTWTYQEKTQIPL